jgi:hypothetical protein
MLKRNITETLEAWKHSRIRRPLLVRGARQVGKTHAVQWFAKTNFKNYTVVNFEERPEMTTCFDSLRVRDILEKNLPFYPHRYQSRGNLVVFGRNTGMPASDSSTSLFF